MTNNDILKKLRVALQLRDEDIVKILALVEYETTTSELSAFFRAENHPNYKDCGDQILRNFLNGLIIHLRGPKTEKPSVAPEPTAKTPEVKKNKSNLKVVKKSVSKEKK